MTTTTAQDAPGTETDAPTAGRARRIGFRVVAGLLTLAMGLTGGHLLVTGWTDPTDGGIHRLQDLHWGVVEGLLLAVAMGWQLRRPERHAGAMRVALLAVVAQLVCAAGALAPDPFGIVLLALVLGALALHPARRDVVRPALAPDRLLLAPAVAGALALAVFSAVQVAHHHTASSGDLLEAKTGWLGAAFCGLALALVVLAAALLRSTAATVLGAAGLAVVGVGSLLHPSAASSFGSIGGAGALVLAVALLLVVVVQLRGQGESDSVTSPS